MQFDKKKRIICNKDSKKNSHAEGDKENMKVGDKVSYREELREALITFSEAGLAQSERNTLNEKRDVCESTHRSFLASTCSGRDCGRRGES
jgi:hypothetical protein